MTPAGRLLGDLHERVDGGFDGWCWAPDRPQERLVVDLLVNDTVAVSMVAAMFRRDLALRGCGDGRHGFVLHLPPNLPGATEECLITARERRSGQIFGRLLRGGWGGPTTAVAPLAGAAAALAALQEESDELRRRLTAPAVTARVRAAFATLGGELAAIVGRRGAAPALAAVSHPVVTVVLTPASAAAAWRAITALAPALADAQAELLVADSGQDPAVALLPAALANLRYVRATALAQAAARAQGRWLVQLGDEAGAPSAAALLRLARALSHPAQAVLLGGAVAEAVAPLTRPPAAEALTLPARLGLLIAAERALWPAIGAADGLLAGDKVREAADIALRARLLGCQWWLVQEPRAVRPAPQTVLPAAAARAALRLHTGWAA